jgi:hypothetical protein
MSIRTYGWASTEPVEVTAISASAVLIARINRPGAFTLEATEDGDVKINGKATELYDSAWLDLADLVLVGAPGWSLGRTYRVAVSLSETDAIRDVTSLTS